MNTDTLENLVKIIKQNGCSKFYKLEHGELCTGKMCPYCELNTYDNVFRYIKDKLSEKAD